jgi:hypothetical protein
MSNTKTLQAGLRDAAGALPATGWPCDDCSADYHLGANVWREVSADFYDQMRGVVPPVELGQGLPGFMVGEPFTHNNDGHAVHLALVHVGDHGTNRFFARYLPRRAVREPINAFFRALHKRDQT